MRNILFAGMFGVLCFVQSIESRAAQNSSLGPQQKHRWILINAQVTQSEALQSGIEIVKRIGFGQLRRNGNLTFTVVLAPQNMDLRFLLVRTRAMAIQPDFPIGLIIPREVKYPRGESAWHVGKLKYGELPAQYDGKGVTVAVMDTGVDYTHPALVNHMWKNVKEIPGNNIDDDKNGFVDDVYGYDFVNRDGDPKNEGSHGTHCAGIIASDREPVSGAQGVAPGAKIMAVQIIEPKNRETFLSDVAEAVKYAVDNGANILSNSWRIYKSWSAFFPTPQNLQIFRSAMEYAAQKGVIFVAAAGNESTDIDATDPKNPIYPVGFTGIPNLVGVASTDSKDLPSYFTNFGPMRVHVAAPGSDIISTVPDGKWISMSGTSMATPLVAGALARGLSKGLTPEQSIAHLGATSEPNEKLSTKVKSKGIVDLGAYLR